VQRAVEASHARYRQRLDARPVPDYPEQLPVSARRAAIAAAIEEHQVVVVAGETGSGKTTQLPKICLDLGRGVAGVIGHTQPRRLAARAVAGRIAEELRTQVGEAVGYKVRFTDRATPRSHIKLMTDGILLAEVRSDPQLLQYDTLIIDEAHERSLNIDFLLGYLKRLLPKRSDLKVIITSATINTARFAEFFGGAPVIQVSGRTWPVEIRYRPVLEEGEERERDLPQAIVDAVDELQHGPGREPSSGDILVFLPGEREIREAAEALGKHPLRDTEILPLYSRLSAADQNRVFRSHRGRRIVLATNVAETSLTVPGIRYVIDTGVARISRYSPRTKVQRLPIEPVSRASANQRAGRCGRVAPGICIRLYAEEDYLARPEYTDPEVRRTNLASVILQMAFLGLGDPEAFPFIDPPERRHINAGYDLLRELGAMDRQRQLTRLGRRLARLPVDLRIGRMLLAADGERALEEVLIIAAALSIQDPRERPADSQAAADARHTRYHHPRSDFLAFLKLWEYYHDRARHLSQRKLRRLCREEFLSYVRLREWHDVHGQLAALTGELGLRRNREAAEESAIHRALLSGLLSNVALKGERHTYQGARNTTLAIFPGSALFSKPPKWIMAAELVETGRLYARTVAAIDPNWLEPLAGHLVKRSHFEPHWEKRPAQVAAFERVTLYGLPIIVRRKVNYGPIDPLLSRELFIRHALVEGEYRCDAPFFRHNRALIAEVEALEAKSRRRDLLVDEETLFAFYDARIPEGIYSGKGFEKWRRQAESGDPERLFLTREKLMQHSATGVTGAQYPDQMEVNGIRLPLRYHFEPGHPADGVTALIPLAVLPQLDPAPFEWLVPGLLLEKLIALIKGLPKAQRRNFVPAVNFAEAALPLLQSDNEGLLPAFTRELQRMTGISVPPEQWPWTLPDHLRMNFRVVDPAGAVQAEGRELQALQKRLREEARSVLEQTPSSGWERKGITAWDFGDLPPSVEVEQMGVVWRAWPALTEERNDSVALRLFESAERAAHHHRAGVRRLCMLQSANAVRVLRQRLPGIERMCLHFAPVGSCADLRADLLRASCDRAFLGEAEPPRTETGFTQLLEAGRQVLPEIGEAICRWVGEALHAYHAAAKMTRGAVDPRWLSALSDVRGQLEGLIYPGFVTATPYERLRHLPRYLEAARLRLEKLARHPQRDRQAQQQLAPLVEAVEKGLRLAAQEEQARFVELRWQLEELRVSLFAQELGTEGSVSVKRIERALAELRR